MSHHVGDVDEFAAFYARASTVAGGLRGRRVLVVGLGAVGSQVAWWLARCGPDLTLVDRDIVEAPNLARQRFSSTAIGGSKALGHNLGTPLPHPHQEPRPTPPRHPSPSLETQHKEPDPRSLGVGFEHSLSGGRSRIRTCEG